MVKKLPIRVRMKPVIQALREGKKTWTELLKLGVPEKTLHRILTDYLMYWNLVRKDGRYWVWYENVKVFDSKHDYDLALEHSRKLLPAFESMLDIGETQRHNLEFAAIQHLKSYPEIYTKLQSIDKTFKQRATEVFSKRYQGSLYFLALEEKSEIYKELAGDIHLLMLKIKMGQPLEGVCSICPKIKILENGDVSPE